MVVTGVQAAVLERSICALARWRVTESVWYRVCTALLILLPFAVAFDLAMVCKTDRARGPHPPKVSTTIGSSRRPL